MSDLPVDLPRLPGPRSEDRARRIEDFEIVHSIRRCSHAWGVGWNTSPTITEISEAVVAEVVREVKRLIALGYEPMGELKLPGPSLAYGGNSIYSTVQCSQKMVKYHEG